MERIGALLPSGGRDEDVHRGARRRHARYTLNAQVSVLVPIRARGVVLNASMGGLRIGLDREIAVGELCALDVRFTESRRSLEPCRVVWSRALPDGYLLGLEFVDLH